jgi:DNA-binding PadR family transcriptional regulator
VGNQRGPSTAKAFWLAESQLGLQVAKAEGFIDESTDGSLRITDYTLTDRGRAWLTRDGSPIAASVRNIELRGVL